MRAPRVLTAVVAVVAFRYSFETEGGLDPSWELGLGWGRQFGLVHGGDLAFTWGPLAPLGVPTLASSGWWIGTSLIASAAVAIWFARVILRSVDGELLGRWALPLALGAGVLIGSSLGFPDAVAVTTALDVYTRLPSTTDRPPTAARLAGFGALVAVIAMVKISSGVIVAVAVVILALAWPPWRARVRALLTVAVGGGVTAAVLWLVTGGSAHDFALWLRSSVDMISGYGAAMGITYDVGWVVVQLVVFAALTAMLVVGLVVRFRKNVGVVRWPEPVLLGLMAWFLLKSGLVRFDTGHVDTPLIGVTLLILVVAARLQWRAFAGVALVLAVFGLSLSPTAGTPTQPWRIARGRSDQPEQVLNAVRAVVSTSARADQTEEAREEIRAFYRAKGLTAPMITAVEGHRVHAEQWDIAALWAHHLTWQPLPIIQTYSAYTTYLDDRNAELMADAKDGPDAILLNVLGVDHRIAAWDSPKARVEMTCHFESVVQDARWAALHRTTNICGSPREIGALRAEPGEVLELPDPGPDELLVATFDIQPSLLKQVVDVLARDPRLPYAYANGFRTRFVPGTASNLHLLVTPERFGDRDLAGPPLDLETLRFENLGGPVDVTFYVVPLG